MPQTWTQAGSRKEEEEVKEDEKIFGWEIETVTQQSFQRKKEQKTMTLPNSKTSTIPSVCYKSERALLSYVNTCFFGWHAQCAKIHIKM